MNIGILGGSFDPIHNGHLHMAKCAYESYALDQVWLIPAGHSPNKDEHGMTDAKDRFQMCKLAAQPYPWMTVSRLELDSAERSYTYRTMEKLSEQFPMHRFFFIMGGDSLDYFEQWKQPERIAKLATILVIPRDLFTIAALEKKIRISQGNCSCNKRIFFSSAAMVKRSLGITRIVASLAIRSVCCRNNFPVISGSFPVNVF